MPFMSWALCILVTLISSARSWFELFRYVQDLNDLGQHQGSKRRAETSRGGYSTSGDSLLMNHFLMKIARHFRRWNRSPAELAKRRALRRQRRLKKAKKKKLPKKSSKFERRKSPPRRGSQPRRMNRLKIHYKARRKATCWEKEQRYLTCVNPVVESLILSSLPCVAQDFETSPLSVPSTESLKVESVGAKEPLRSATARTTIVPRQSPKCPENSYPESKDLMPLMLISETCQKCRWVGKRRMTLGGFRRPKRRRTRRFRRSPAYRRRGPKSSVETCISEVDSTSSFCSQSSPLYISSSTPVLERSKQTWTSVEEWGPWVLPWRWLQRFSLIFQTKGSIILPQPFGRTRKPRSSGFRPGEIAVRETQADMGRDASRESKHALGCHGTILGVNLELKRKNVSACVGDQLGKAYSSNNSGDGPESGITDSPRRCHEVDRRWLDAFHGAARGDLWPLPLQWDPKSEPNTWSGVEVDVDLRVIGLKLDFGEDEGAARRFDKIYDECENLTFQSNEQFVEKAGRIPHELRRLDRLVVLQLRWMGLGGSVPKELSSLTQLRVLDLCRNKLTGFIPTELSSLIHLQELNLAWNRLKGPIPKELRSLTSLNKLCLGWNQLTGYIPTDLCDLTQLQGLYLGGNQLTGMIPKGLSRLTRLQELYLWRNQLTGTIRIVLSTLTSLEELYLDGNQQTGSIPKTLSSLTRLQGLSLGGNQLTGSIPTELSSLTQLKELNLDGNQLSGSIPTALSTLTQLQELNLSYNHLTGPIPKELSSLVSLNELNLDRNELTDSIPKKLASLTQLRRLNLSVNSITGSIPTKLSRLTQLWELYLDRNQLTGSIPDELSNLAQLRELYLWRNELTESNHAAGGSGTNLSRALLNQMGSIPRELSNLRNLHRLNLSSNKLTGPIPSELSSLTLLQDLYLDGNQLEGSIPTELSSMTQLQELYLLRNQLTGCIPTELSSLTQLRRLNLSVNKLSGSVPIGLSSLTQLQELGLDENQLIGVIPTELSSLSQLQELNLSYNQLRGSIPTELSSLTQLQKLNLDRNHLIGCIPAEVSGLTQLRKLYLAWNELTGNIPTQLSSLRQLEELYLDGNHLTGSIPKELSSLTQLQELYLWQNELTGPIPSELSSLVRLKELNFDRNQLTGSIPTELSSLTQLQELYLGGNQLTGLWDQSTILGGGDLLNADGTLPYWLSGYLDWLANMSRTRLLPNPFRQPPAAIVSRGVKAIKEYCEDLLQDEYVHERRDVKAVIVGEAGAGKTSLRQSIRKRRPKPTKDDHSESTVHLDIEPIQLDDLTVSFYDCAGQDAYYGLLQNFFTEQAVYLVVCDMRRFWSPRDEKDGGRLESDVRKLEELGICGWLRCLSWRIPDCDVILVGTKCDLLAGDVMKDVARRVEDACRKWLNDWAGTGRKLTIEPGVSLTSCKGKTTGGKVRAWLHGKERWLCDRGLGLDGASTASLLHRITHKSQEDVYRGVGTTIPRGWLIAQHVLDAIAANRDPISWVLQQLQSRYVPTRQGNVEAATETEGVIRTTDLESRWRDVVLTLQRNHNVFIPNPHRALQGALLIREYEGRILRQEPYVFFDVMRLAKILKPILNHKHEEDTNGDIIIDVDAAEPLVLSTAALKDSWERLIVQGILDIELARKLWPNDLWRFVLPTLKNMDLAFPLQSDDSKLVVMLRLPTCRPEIADETLRDFRRDNYPTLEASWTLHLGSPPGVIEKVLTRCCGLGATRIFWRFGVLVTGNLGGKFALVLEFLHGKLELQVHGNPQSVAPWIALSYALSAMRSKTLEYPGLKWKASLGCPKHSKGLLRVSDETREPGQRLMCEGGCFACNRENGDLGAFAEEMLTMVNVQQPRDTIFDTMKSKFLEIGKHYWEPSIMEPHRAGRWGRLDHESAQPEPFREAFRDMKQDMRHTLENISRQRGIPVDDRGHVSPDAHEEKDNDSYSSRGTLANEKTLLQRLDVGQQELVQGQQRLMQICSAIKAQGDDSRAVLDFVKDMAKALRADQFEAPRLACLLPPWSFARSRGLSPTEQHPRTWKRRVQEGVKKKTFFTKSMRLFLVCAKTYRLVPCGLHGQGYKIEELRDLVRKIFGVVRVIVEFTALTLGLASAAGLMSNLMEAVGTTSEMLRSEDLVGLMARYGEVAYSKGQRIIEQRQSVNPESAVEPLVARAYESLKDFIYDQEDAAFAEMVKDMRKARRKDSPPPDTTWFIFFRDVMETIQDDQGSGEAHWVLR